MSDKQTIIKLRTQTGAGIVDIKEALDEAGGDEEKALDILREKGQKIAAKRADRETGEGWVGSYVHANGKVSAQVKLMCETDFVARNEDFQQLAYNLAMQVVATDPVYLNKEAVPEGKSVDDEELLINQKFIKDDSKTIQQLLDEATAKIGEKIEIAGYSRLQI
ncbi:elongation factor Ts [bacterium]|jgi:elongation factor Ts|nr:elongation factor Ts [bacterium]MDP6571684.1 elongation factor Ts [Patescibacteria group bacterium]MDP6756570.1 elongation factor Ts [Patescibacteria group bacterium]|tara:strand:+ start:18400 stop:18891 length:492 start_codon:yes stop_codon:yes gene_type:complete